MSDEAIVAITAAFFAAIPPTLTAAAAFWQGRKNGAAALQLVEKSNKLVEKSESIEKKSDKIVKQNEVLEKKSDAIVEKNEDLSKQNTEIIQKSDEIHGLTNSNLERVNNELSAAHKEITELKELIGQLASDGEETRAYAKQEMKKGDK